MRLTLLLLNECQRLWLLPGTRIACCRGRLWLTLEAQPLHGASPDIVLEAGDRYVVRAPGQYFLSHLGPQQPAECALELPRQPAARGWHALLPAAVSARRQAARWT